MWYILFVSFISDYRQTFQDVQAFAKISDDYRDKISKWGDAIKGSFIGHKIDIIKIDIDKHEQMFYPK